MNKRDELHKKWLGYSKKVKELDKLERESNFKGMGKTNTHLSLTIMKKMFEEQADLSRLMLD